MSKKIVLTDEQKIELKTLAAVLNTQQIADYFGFDQDTFTAIMKRDADVLRIYKKGKAKAIGRMGGSLLQKGFNGDTTAMIFYLKTQAGWREPRDEDINPNNGASQDTSISFIVKGPKAEVKVTHGKS